MIKYSYNILVGGIPIPLKNHGVKVSWDDENSQYIPIIFPIYGLFLWFFYGFPMGFRHNPFMFQSPPTSIYHQKLHGLFYIIINHH